MLTKAVISKTIPGVGWSIEVPLNVVWEYIFPNPSVGWSWTVKKDR